MALSLKIAGTDRIGVLERESLEIEQDASSYAATCSFTLIDVDNTLPVAELDEVLIEDGDVLFHGEIAGVKREQIVINNKDAWRLRISCVDDHAKLDRVTVEYAHWDDLAATDIEMIADLFAAYYPSGIDYSTYVTGTPLDPAMVEQTFEGISMREAIGKIAELSGGRFYVHYAGGILYFHYFASESNVAAFHLTDDSPDYSSSYPYNSIDEERDASELVNAVYIVGADTAKWVEDATSIAAYGRREGAVTNADLLTEAAVDDYGATFIAEHKDPKVRYQVHTAYGAGLRAGMQVRVVCTPKSLDATLNINSLQISHTADTPYWDLDLGDTVPDFVSSGRSLSDQISDTVVQVTEISQDVFDVEAPAAPAFAAGNLTTFVIEDADGHQIVCIRATWGEVSDADLDHYEVQLADNDAFNWPMVGLIRAGETREYQWNGLKGNTSYYARVRAVDWVGNYSAWQPTSPGYLTITSSADSTAPAQVTGAAAAGARTLIGITWTDNTEADLSHYEIQASANGTTGWTTRDAPRRSMFIDYSFTEAQIQAGTARYYRIRAVDTSGNAGDYSATVNASVSAIGSDTIAAGAIITDKLAANCVVAGKVAANAIDTDQLIAGAVQADKCDISTLSAITANMGILTAGEIRIGTGTVGSNFTGFRILSSYIGGYNNDTLQVGIASSDGRLYLGGALIRGDSTGLKLQSQAGITGAQRLAWTAANWTTEYGAVVADTDGDMFVVGTNSVRLLDAVGYADLIGGNFILYDLGSGSGKFFINDTANANMTLGITINQGANDDEAIAFKSSDVAHGATDYTETDTWGLLKKAEATSGGLYAQGFKDADGVAGFALTLGGFLAEDANTTKTTSGYGIVDIEAFQTSGTGLANTVADGNVFSIRTRRGDTVVAVFLVDEDGDVLYDGAASAYDQEDDVALVRELADLLSMPAAERTEHVRRPEARARSEALAIAHADENGVMISQKRHTALLRGALLQLSERVVRLEQEVARRGEGRIP